MMEDQQYNRDERIAIMIAARDHGTIIDYNNQTMNLIKAVNIAARELEDSDE